MRVESPAMNMNVEVRGVEECSDELVLSGIVNTMPCRIVMASAELRQLAGLLFNRRVMGYVLRSLMRAKP